MEQEFLDWFEANEKRFAHGQFDDKQIAYSAWLEGRKAVNKNCSIPDVSNSLLYDKLAVVIKTKEGKIYQVALDQEMCDVLYGELKDFFKGGKVKILPTEITAIDLD